MSDESKNEPKRKPTIEIMGSNIKSVNIRGKNAEFAKGEASTIVTLRDDPGDATLDVAVTLEDGTEKTVHYTYGKNRPNQIIMVAPFSSSENPIVAAIKEVADAIRSRELPKRK